jgi:glutaredoxin
MGLRDRLDQLRAAAAGGLAKVPGKPGELLARANDALGRPLANSEELAERRAFEDRGKEAADRKPEARGPRPDPAPVIVYHMDKQRRDVSKVTDVLDVAGVPYKVMNIETDPAAQMAIRRDSKGNRLPVVFIAGECVGGREALVNLSTSGELAKKVYG